MPNSPEPTVYHQQQRNNIPLNRNHKKGYQRTDDMSRGGLQCIRTLSHGVGRHQRLCKWSLTPLFRRGTAVSVPLGSARRYQSGIAQITDTPSRMNQQGAHPSSDWDQVDVSEWFVRRRSNDSISESCSNGSIERGFPSEWYSP